jgi:predicted nucleic acid-binding protein
MSVVSGEGLYFLDTNIFVYSFDVASPEKQRIAQQLIGHALKSQRGAISTQVVQEFLNLALRRFAHPFSPPEARDYLERILAPLCFHFPSTSFYAHALVIQLETGYSWYDALIVTAALDLDCKTLVTEDLQTGRTIRGLTVVNPFAS